MKSMLYTAALVLTMSFGGVSTAVVAEPGRIAAGSATAVSASSADAPSTLQQALAFNRELPLAARPGAPDKCSFKPSKNPLRQRKNECRLA
jgi:hypothetical protein